tara:strand:- start:3643 stop:7350 length:3708 start_codon:yes stop_codon:yes gene_type:complete
MTFIHTEANNCVIEVGEITGNKDIYKAVPGTPITTYTFEGCIDTNPSSIDQAFNSGQRVVYTGVVPHQQVGYTMETATSIGYLGVSQVCDVKNILWWWRLVPGWPPSFSFDRLNPGQTTNSNKLVAMLLEESPGDASNFNFISPVDDTVWGGTIKQWTPRNSQNHPDNISGRCLYFVNESRRQGGTGASCTKRLGVCFDIVTGSNTIDNQVILKGSGCDQASRYYSICELFYADQDDYSWYISAYMHNMSWDSSLGSGNPIIWTGGSLSNDFKTEIGSYEGSRFRSTNVSYEHNSCFDDSDTLGLRSSAFHGVGAGSVNNPAIDCWEITITVTSIINAKLKVLQGSPSSSVTPVQPQADGIFYHLTGMNIEAPGAYTFCLSGLKRPKYWGDQDANNGSVPSTGGYDFDWADGAVELVQAEARDGNAFAQIIIEEIKITKKEPEWRTIVTQTSTTQLEYSIDEISYTYLDAFENSALPIALTYKVGNLKSLGAQGTGYSKTFDIPASKRNCSVLDPMLATGAETNKINWMPSRVSANGIVVFSGLLRVEQGVTGNGGSFTCHIVQDGTDWANLLKDKKICDVVLNPDLGWGGSDNKKSFHNIFNSWYNTPNDSDYFYGLVNYGEWHAQSTNATPSSHDYHHNANDFHPAIFAKTLVREIFTNIGYAVESQFFESDVFEKLCHPYSSGEEYIDSDLFGTPGSPGGSQYAKAEGSASKHPTDGTFHSNGKMPGDTGTLYRWWPTLNATTDISNNWHGNSSGSSASSAGQGYVVPFTGDYDITIAGTLYFKQHWDATSSSYIRASLCLNGTPVSNVYWSLYHVSGSADGVSGMDSTTLALNTGDQLTLKITGENFSDYAFAPGGYPAWVDVSEMLLAAFPIQGSVVPDYEVNLTKILPCTTQSNYLKGLTELFNLQWTADNTKKIISVEPYNDFFGSGSLLDWTNKLDMTSWTDKYIAKDLAQTVDFEYKQDNGDIGINGLYDWREANNHSIYKSHTEDPEDTRFKAETLKLGSTVFHSTYRFNAYGVQGNVGVHGSSHFAAPGAYAWGDLTWTDPLNNQDNPLMPVIWTGGNGHVNGMESWRPDYVPNPKCGLRILNYYGRKGCADWDFVRSNGAIWTFVGYPYMDWIDGWRQGISIDPYNLSWGDHDDGKGHVSPGLFSKYWSHAFDRMSGGATTRTCKMNLTAGDIARFDYRDLIHIKIDSVSTYWTVQAIKDYKPNKKELTTVELIEWKYDSNKV